jgi:hypothetical protein
VILRDVDPIELVAAPVIGEGLSAVRRGGIWASNTTQEDQDQEDDDDQTESAARGISPGAAVTPGRQRADEHQDQEYEEDGPEGHGGCLAIEERKGAAGPSGTRTGIAGAASYGMAFGSHSPS